MYESSLLGAKSTIDTFAMNWHLNQSPAFKIVLETPLAPYLQLRFRDVEDFEDTRENLSQAAIFLQIPPPVEAFDRYERVIWVPMWDMSFRWLEKTLETLPTKLKIIAFTPHISAITEERGYRTFTTRFYLNPDDYPKVSSTKRTLFYWNRLSIVLREDLQRLCTGLNIEQLIFRDQPDYRLPPELAYEMPSRFGSTQVENLVATERDAYLAALQRANVFLAPRVREGIGLAFIEAMAMGSVVIAPDSPTMSDYIQHGENGFLLPINKAQVDANQQRLILHYHRNYSTQNRIKYGWLKLMRRLPIYDTLLHLTGDLLDEIKQSDWSSVGDCARQTTANGYQNWQKALPELADFILT